MAEDDQTSARGQDPGLAALVATLTERVSALERLVESMVQAREGRPANEVPRGVPARQVPPPPVFRQIEPVAQRSLEDRLGSQIFNRVAIVALLVGAALGLKLAIDNHWIGALGRVIVGLVAGIGLVAWSERFRRKEFAAFSYSLKAVGTGVLYLSLWAAFQLYHLLPGAAAFGLMLLVTAWNAWMAWQQESELLAAYAIAGGFATPLLVSTGGNHQVFLFSYILSLDVATVTLVRLRESRGKSWARLLLPALAATALYFIAWFSSYYTAEQLASTSVFIGLFFLAFLSVPLRFGEAQPELDAPVEFAGSLTAITDVLLPLGNAVFGSLAFYSVLEDSHNHAALPWVALVFAAIYLGVMRLPQTVAARAVHLSLAVVFVTVAIPLKATGRWITIGWLAEGVSLLWITARLEHGETPASVHRMLRRLAAVALALGFTGLMTLPYWLDLRTQTAFFNARFATALAGIAGLGIAAWVSVRANAVFTDKAFPDWVQLAGASVVGLNLVALQAGIVEIETYWKPGLGYAVNAESGLQAALSISGYLMLYGAVLLAAGFWRQSAFLRWQALGLLVVAIAKVFLYDVRSLSQGYRVVSFLALGALLMGVSFVYVKRTGKASEG